jgi:predicted chitinase
MKVRAVLGNATGDRMKFMGRGFHHEITGRANYTNFANFVKLSLDDTIKYLETIEGAVMSPYTGIGTQKLKCTQPTKMTLKQLLKNQWWI